MAKDTKATKKERRPQAEKREIQNEKRRLRNKMFRSEVRTAIRSFETTLSKGEGAATKEALNHVYSLMDKGVKKGVYNLNKASRTKGRLAARCVAKT